MSIETERNDADLDWLSFLYVTGELSRDERDDFERRLDFDQSAREAVARAVELNESIALIERDTASRSQPIPFGAFGSVCGASGAVRSSSPYWMAAIAAVALSGLVAVVLVLNRGPAINSRTDDPTQSLAGSEASTGAPEVALAWANARSADDSEPTIEEATNRRFDVGETGVEADSTPEMPAEIGLDVDLDETTIRGWVLTATALIATGDDPAIDPQTVQEGASLQ